MSIRMENTQVFGIEAAVRGMRNPMNSWNKSDSFTCTSYSLNGCFCRCKDVEKCFNGFVIGNADYELMKCLREAGSEHRKFMRMITVYVDVTAPLYWWKEFETYKIGTVSNSCSTMHRIHSKEFSPSDFSMEHLEGISLNAMQYTIDTLNHFRELYLSSTKEKSFWWQMIQLLPSSYNQKRTICMNYEVITRIYEQRNGHKLDEWNDLCDWIKTLPFSNLIRNTERMD